jgi:tRNA (adenine22-N1)-methyltransferase
MLSKRLTMILDLIEPCEILVDIGSDHGYLALEALMSHRAKQIIASDVRIGPLKQAQQTFAKANVFENVSYVISNGLQAIETLPDAVIISGMGAELILTIIENDLERFKMIPQIVVQANTKLDVLRKGMAELGFSMRREALVKDGFFYIGQSYRFTGLCEELDVFQAHYGMMIDPKDPIYTEYLRSELDRQIHILRTNPNSAKHKALFELIKTRLDKRVD